MHTRTRLTQRWVLVLAVAAGLVGMHHMTAYSPAAHEPAGPASAPAVIGAHPGTAPPMIMAGTRAPAVAAAADSAMDMAMHSCLAVLAALFVLALLVALVRRRDPGRAVAVGVGFGWARPPPRTAVRLALRCVLLNWSTSVFPLVRSPFPT